MSLGHFGKAVVVLGMHHPVILIGGVTIALTTIAGAKLIRHLRIKRHLRRYLDDDCGLITDHIEEGYGEHETPALAWHEKFIAEVQEFFKPKGVLKSQTRSTDIVVYNATVATARGSSPVLLETGHPNLTPSQPNAIVETMVIPTAQTPCAFTTIRGAGLLLHEHVEVTTHRRVRRGRRRQFINCVLKETKLRFGTPSKTEANMKAISNYASSIMNKHGMRPSQAMAFLPKVVSLTFIPSKAERLAARLLKSSTVLTLHRQHRGNLAQAGFVQQH